MQHYSTSPCGYVAEPIFCTEAFTVKEFINESLRPLGCEVSERTIYNAFEEVFKRRHITLFLQKLTLVMDSSVLELQVSTAITRNDIRTIGY